MENIIFKTDFIYNKVDEDSFQLSIIQTSENRYSIYNWFEFWKKIWWANNTNTRSILSNLMIKDILEDVKKIVSQTAKEIWEKYKEEKWIYSFDDELSSIIQERIQELRNWLNEDMTWLDLCDFEWELFASVNSEIKIKENEKSIKEDKESKNLIHYHDINFKEAFDNKDIIDLNINSIFIDPYWKLKIFTSNWWNKSIEWTTESALWLLLDYVEWIANKFKKWENIKELIVFTYNSWEKKWMNLIWIQWENQEKKEKIFDDFFTIVSIDKEFNKTTFGHWIKKNFVLSNTWIWRIQFRV